MALWQFVVMGALLAALIGTLLFATSVVAKRIGYTNAALRRIEEALVSANHRAAQSLVKAAETVSASPSETFSSAATPGYLTVRDLKMISGASGPVTESSPAMHADPRTSLQRQIELDRRNRPERRIPSERPAPIETSGETAVRVSVTGHDAQEVAGEPCVSAALTNWAPVVPVTPATSVSPMVCVSPAAVSIASMSPVVSELLPGSEFHVVSGSAMTSESLVPLESRAVEPDGAALPVASMHKKWPIAIPQSQAAEPNGQSAATVGLSDSVEGVTAELENQRELDTGNLSCHPTVSSEDSVAVTSDSDQSPSVNSDSLRPAGAVDEDEAAKRNQEMYLLLSSQRRRRRARGG